MEVWPDQWMDGDETLGQHPPMDGWDGATTTATAAFSRCLLMWLPSTPATSCST
ncbi:hypothetical protein TRIUR3_18613 [Triticum urartu]|uniref:Uncharacterized protein n=1 Tax=Triticum urartu TaxID=4572 RepID=M8AJS3_TRIUA|nr:hypothetical protein TRIUR3_18613 [Triticum urartu]